MTPESIVNRPFFCSWSGGKDSCLALYRALRAGGEPRVLLTMLAEDGVHSRSHGLSLGVLQAQADALGFDLVTRAVTWDGYEEAFLDALRELAGRGLHDGVFGDIDLQGHLDWVERVCGSAGVAPWEPLWKGERATLLSEFLDAGFRAVIVAVKDERLDARFLGRTLDAALLPELEAAGVDLCGEEGEYHTVVIDGPLFRRPVRLEHGEIRSHDGYSFLEVSPPS